MKRLFILLCLVTSVALADIQPDSFSNTWARSDVTVLMDTNIWNTYVTYLLTNNYVVASDGVSTQDLTGLGIDIRVGDASTNVLYHGVATATPANGLFSCFFSVPTSSPNSIRIMASFIQLSLTNAAGTRVTFKGQKQLNVINPLH